MFVLATLLYPCVLALLCLGAGLLVDRVSGSFLPVVLLPVVGAATLIGLSQLTTYIVFLAPATPYLLAVIALAGFALGRRRVTRMFGWGSLEAPGKAAAATATTTAEAPGGWTGTLGRGHAERQARGAWRRCGWQLVVPVLAYLAALAPVLFAGRPSFSSYGVLTDSAFHMLGADFLIHHGQDYSHLDLSNSPGQYINDYYNTYYPSGADTLFGASALLVRVPLIWAFQPFNAFMLALCTGPAWLLVRRLGLDGRLAALATLTVTLPALVYGYELIASVKEITSLSLILALGALVVLHPRWLRGPPRGVVPFALVGAAGVSALGVAFGAWALTAAVVLAAIMIREVVGGDRTPETIAPSEIAPDHSRSRGALLFVAIGLLVAFLAALGTWLELSGSLQIARNIAATNNPGNLQNPLRTVQILGTWLTSSYKHVPAGGDLTASYVLALLALAAAVLGTAYVVYRREYALVAWIALTLAVWLGLTAYGTTWADGKALMLTSPVVVLLAWGGVAALRDWARMRPAKRESIDASSSSRSAAGIAATEIRVRFGPRPRHTIGAPACVPVGSRAAGARARRRRRRLRRAAVPRLEPRADRALRRARVDRLALRRPGPGVVHRLRRILALLAPRSRRRRPRLHVPAARGRADRGPAGEPRPDLPDGAALLSADRHPPQSHRPAAAGRLPPAVPGRLLRSLGTAPRRAGGTRPRRTRERPLGGVSGDEGDGGERICDPDLEPACGRERG
jgi:hypothetical protein